jgi:hypothetical protein
MVYDADTSCGREYDRGGSYLVYAERDRRDQNNAGISTYSCSRVLPKRQADADVRVLGTSSHPAPVWSARPTAGEIALAMWGRVA